MRCHLGLFCTGAKLAQLHSVLGAFYQVVPGRNTLTQRKVFLHSACYR